MLISSPSSLLMQRETLAHFPAAVPGFVQLRRVSLTGAFETCLMFRTGLRRGVLLYAVDTARFHYVSLALVDGALDLKAFPTYEINTAEGAGDASSASSSAVEATAEGDKESSSDSYSDNEWHTVCVAIDQARIEMHIDDHDYFR